MNLPTAACRWVNYEEISIDEIPKLCSEGCLRQAFQRLRAVIQCGLPISADVFYSAILGCVKAEDLNTSRDVYRLVSLGGLNSDAFLGTHLIRMFASCGSLLEASQVFRRLSATSVYTWSAIILAHAHLGQGTYALDLYQVMLRRNVKPDSHLFVAVLKACAGIASITTGNLIYFHLLVCGYEQVGHIGSALVDMYVKCGSFEDAFEVLDILTQKDAVTWNTIIAGCAQHHLAQEALKLVVRMLEDHMQLDEVTMVSALKACSSIKGLEQGRLIHVYSVEHGYETFLLVSNALVDMYAKCSCIDAAVNVFNRMPKRDVATWSAVAAECAQDEQAHTTLELFPRMELDGIIPDRALFLCILKACSTAVAFHQGKQIHAHFVESGLDFSTDLCIGNALIDMYTKCGSLEDAINVFSSLHARDLVTWNTVIGGCAEFSNFDDVFKYYRLLQQEGHEPDSITFMTLLCACNHLGLVEAACHYFNRMLLVHGISPSSEHHNCIVDLLSHWGHLREAEDFIMSLPVQSDAVGWASLLNQSQLHVNVALAHRCFDNVTSIKGRNATGFLSMSQTCLYNESQWNQGEIEALRSSSNSWKKPGIACIAVGYEVHAFSVGGSIQEQCSDACAKNKRVCMVLRVDGYLPHLDSFV
ncbi:hypothetical protein L7F22_016859 [Adiantum nelumboides]|nr:hypothetical protein [Adiantum nelumboides]